MSLEGSKEGFGLTCQCLPFCSSIIDGRHALRLSRMLCYDLVNALSSLLPRPYTSTFL